VRSRARVALREQAARPELHGPVIREGTRVLGGNDWRGQEQAAVLLGQLDHKPASKRLLELLRVERGETKVAVAWALRKIAVPDTLPVVLDFVRDQHREMMDAARANRRTHSGWRDRQLSQLIQFMGVARYRPADSAIREMLPRLIPGLPANPSETPLGAETRTAAVWAIGLMYEGKPDPALVRQLTSRLTDLPSPAGAEHDSVRRVAAISLGRMKAKDATATLKRFYIDKPTLDPVSNACGWALSQITGEPLPPPGIVEQMDRRWFLAPID
jgi:HEAT repeat protein